MVHDKRPRAKIRSQLLHVHTLAPTLSGSVLGSVQGRGITAVQLVGLARATRWGYSLWELEVLGSCTCNRCNSTEVSSAPPHPVPLPDNKRSELCDTLTAVACFAPPNPRRFAQLPAASHGSTQTSYVRLIL